MDSKRCFLFLESMDIFQRKTTQIFSWTQFMFLHQPCYLPSIVNYVFELVVNFDGYLFGFSLFNYDILGNFEILM
jgi:hypothetical protein